MTDEVIIGSHNITAVNTKNLKEGKMFDFRWLKEHKGQGMVEYILIVVVVVGILFAGYSIFGGKVRQAFEHGGDKIESEANEAFNDN
jgi:Flp pilus assembly pilin Flp